MSVSLPVCSVVFGSVTPPQGDVLDLRVHLGCTNEVSSFECLLQNFDEKYSPGGTYPISVGANGSISIGRGANCPLIITLRVEEVECESTPNENYIRVRGRCWGEKLFRRVVTKTYENKKGEEIVKDLIDNYVSLSHARDSTELIENTDTTYTKLEYENTPVMDILKYIAESADKTGVIGFDFRVAPDGKFEFFPRNSKTSSVSLSERLELSEYRKDIHRIRNKVTVYGAAEKPNPSDKDAWTESLTPTDGAWSSGTGTGSVSLDTVTKIVGTASIKHTTSTPDYYGSAVFTLDAGKEVDSNKYPSLTFQVRLGGSAFNGTIIVWLYDAAGKDAYMNLGNIKNDEKWYKQTIRCGSKNADQNWTVVASGFDWSQIKKFRIDANFVGTNTGSFWVDNLFFNSRRWEAVQEDTGSQTAYGLRELAETDEELHSDNECLLRAKALLDFYKNPIEYLTLHSEVIDYGTPLLAGDKIHVTLPNENIDAGYRIISVEYRVSGKEQTLEISLEVGKEPALLADYLYALRSKTSSLARYKAGPDGVATAGGGGGGGGGADEKVKVSTTDTTTDYLSSKIAVDDTLTKTVLNPSGNEQLQLKQTANSVVQKVEVSEAGTLRGTRKRINFVHFSTTDDPANDRVNVSGVNYVGAGTGISVSPNQGNVSVTNTMPGKNIDAGLRTSSDTSGSTTSTSYVDVLSIDYSDPEVSIYNVGTYGFLQAYCSAAFQGYMRLITYSSSGIVDILIPGTTNYCPYQLDDSYAYSIGAGSANAVAKLSVKANSGYTVYYAKRRLFVLTRQT